MKITIEIDCDNAAFEDEPGSEVARILRNYARQIEDRPMSGGCQSFKGYARNDGYDVLRDVNGNRAGIVTFEHDGEGDDGEEEE